MISAYTGTSVRRAEQPLLAAGQGAELMQRAAYGLYAATAAELAARRRIYGSRVVVLAGSGNNGADALYAASRLAARGAAVTALLTSQAAHSEALAAVRAEGGRVATLDDHNAPALVRAVLAADAVIDGVLGTGGRGGLRGPVQVLAEALNYRPPGSGPLVVACDLPSGVDADSGQAPGTCLHADLTVTFGAVKTGLLAGPGAAAAGRIRCIDIGLGPYLGAPEAFRLQDEDLPGLLPVPGPRDHKYSRGVLGIAAGSATYPGAALMATGAALATGTGMVRYLGPDSVARLVNLTHPEAVCSTGTVSLTHVQAWLAGPGAGEDEAQHRRAADAMSSGLPAVIDADAIGGVRPGLHAGVVLTPHAGELTALLRSLGEEADRTGIEADPVRWVRRAAELTGATVLLKGWATLVAAPTGELYSQAEATPWLATAGSGDTLSGILGALLATDRTPGAEREPGHYARLAAAAASLHGRAGVLASAAGPVEPSQLGPLIRSLVAEFTPRRNPKFK
ncbi:NAD(P)H-hydrate epimerase [Arthrobacter sp. zg-Y20]|uniref:NAD(P)H-hydrate epimerase n=1 Tax=unclassified Arthrobacter TaxID=235627 RepID=UPI001D132911|nr:MULTISPECIES: NAD(P)H-hydrate epimerase [unclassified Arthrobacter]MCC3276119.1 NAD(P)H-hydrate epimerase [Arthrobacter sp. zg-Y20]MDK1316279.1 NAD(P)H-hydrate epimerase [Arthrobacter sp. zg.Y20]WIB05442.1 NAD(P)H-hydrate epimerase [Arthrobacter sp. zg-Y20]